MLLYQRMRWGRWLLLGLSLMLVLGMMTGCDGYEETVTPPASVTDVLTDAPTEAPTEAPVTVAPPGDGPQTQPGEVPMPENPLERDGMYAAPPAMILDPAKYYVATIETERGDIVVELFADRVPRTVNSFVFLAQEGFYDNTTFHRVIPGFMAQAGDPTGRGTGSPGYRFADEFDPTLGHDRVGMLSMANSGPGTNGSQFFITFGPTTWLDDQHTVFGQVIGGLEVLYTISPRDPQAATTPGDLIETISIAALDAPPVSELPAHEAVTVPSNVAARHNLYAQPPALQIEEGRTYTARIETAKGAIVVELDAGAAPLTVNNFVALVRAGFYDGIVFHRVEPGFVIQGGDPLGSGQGGPGYVLPAEIELLHTEGAIAMARLPDQGNPRRMSSGSQFYITLEATPMLDGQYTVFGYVIEGMDVVQSIEIGDVIASITIQ